MATSSWYTRHAHQSWWTDSLRRDAKPPKRISRGPMNWRRIVRASRSGLRSGSGHSRCSGAKLLSHVDACCPVSRTPWFTHSWSPSHQSTSNRTLALSPSALPSCRSASISCPARHTSTSIRLRMPVLGYILARFSFFRSIYRHRQTRWKDPAPLQPEAR